MHKLNRGGPPTCLTSYLYGLNNWGHVTPANKTDIWYELEAMQGKRCAYCEKDITNSNKHIEHFRQRSRYPQGTFAWENLFGSCNREVSCGKHKDGCGAYTPADIIKPDVEDPEVYLVFSQDGSVNPRKNLSPADYHRATETIRIFNLNGALRQIRVSQVVGYVQTAEAIAEMAVFFPVSDWLPWLQQEIAMTADLPFATAIKHVLTRQSSNP